MLPTLALCQREDLGASVIVSLLTNPQREISSHWKKKKKGLVIVGCSQAIVAIEVAF